MMMASVSTLGVRWVTQLGVNAYSCGLDSFITISVRTSCRDGLVDVGRARLVFALFLRANPLLEHAWPRHNLPLRYKDLSFHSEW